MAEAGLCKDKIRILDFDASLLAQTELLTKYAQPPHSAQVISFKDIASRCRYISTEKTLSKVKERLSGSIRNAITLYGSGDFHHISSVLIPSGPVGVIVFDYHPDWDGCSPYVSCGSWVSRISRMENVKKIILLGPSSEDLSAKGLSTAYLKGLGSGKLEIFPYKKQPSKTYFRYLKDTACCRVKRSILGSTLYWENLKDKNLTFVSELLKRIPVNDVYVSIDKDCLIGSFAITNWEEGVMPLDWLLGALSVIKAEKNIIGMDITGEYSPISIKNPVKNFLSLLDHPKQTAENLGHSKVCSINEATNLKILDLFLK